MAIFIRALLAAHKDPLSPRPLSPRTLSPSAPPPPRAPSPPLAETFTLKPTPFGHVLGEVCRSLDLSST